MKIQKLVLVQERKERDLQRMIANFTSAELVFFHRLGSIACSVPDPDFEQVHWTNSLLGLNWCLLRTGQRNEVKHRTATLILDNEHNQELVTYTSVQIKQIVEAQHQHL